MKFSNRVIELSNKLQQISFIRAIRDGLVSMIPVLIIGAFSLILQTFPVVAYQNFINNFADGLLLKLFNFVYTATFGVLSVYLTFCISKSYMKIKADLEMVHSGAILCSIVSFFIMVGSYSDDFGLESMGPKSMLIAMIASLGASSLYVLFCRLFKKTRKQQLTDGADHQFNRMLTTLFPITIVVAIFALVNLLIVVVFKEVSFHTLYIKALNGIFSGGTTGFFKGFFFVLLSSILWFFGVHGSDALEGVMQEYFAPGLLVNQAGVEHVVLTKEFFDCFVLMGGCGATICLLIAILIFSKNRARRRLGVTATLPMVFNINELMVFGLPIIFNPIMLIPFLLVPIVCYSVSYLAISTGMVHFIVSEVTWTTPILIGGYYATGSIGGSILQLVNVILGVSIYFPFVKLLDRQSEMLMKNNYDEFIKYYLENEDELEQLNLIDLPNIYGDVAKELAADMHKDLLKNIVLYYQPQYSYEGKCVGVEALLRFEHPKYGKLYPPLVVKIAEDCNLLKKLELQVFEQAISDYDKVKEKYGDVKLSVNITGKMVFDQDFIDLCNKFAEDGEFKNKNICVEVTEKAAISLDEENLETLKGLHSLGLKLAIDDFSMGHTSIQYLKYNIFDLIKLDGSLVKGLTTSINCKEIVSSIVELSLSLNMSVLAEFVETEEEKELLHELGCDNYQGFLYSKAEPL